MNLCTNVHSALVYDFGTAAIKFGFGGYSIPCFRIPPAFARQNRRNDDGLFQFGEEWLQRNLPNIEVVPMLDTDGCWCDSDMFTPFMDWTYTALGEIEPSDWTVLFSQPSCLVSNPDKFRQRRATVAESSFEFANHRAICFQHDSALSCYSFARETGVVIDFGWSCIRVIPVLEGHPLRRSIRQHPLGGFELASLLEKKFDEHGKIVKTHLDPRPNDGFGGLFKPKSDGQFDDIFKPNLVMPTESQMSFCRRSVLIDMIKTTLHFIPRKDESIKDYVYFMAGREPIDIEDEVKFVGARIFETSADGRSLQETIVDAITSAPMELRDAFWEAIMPCGGLARLEGFNARLQKELDAVAADQHPKVLEPICKEASGENAVWAGGSIVASCELFPDLCISKQEWDENGASILDRKCL